MCTGEMKYVILRIDTHVLRIDLCPRNRTRIRRQKQDEDVHLFLSERKKARPQLRQGPSLTPRRSWPRTRQTWQASLTASAEAGKLGRVPGKLRRRLRTPAKLAGYPKGPECTYHGRGVLHTPHQPGCKARMGRTQPARIRPHRVPGPPRVSPWAMVRRPYRAHGYPHQQTNGPQGPNGCTAPPVFDRIGYPARPGFRPGL